MTFKEFMQEFHPSLINDSYSFKRRLLTRLEDIFYKEGQGALNKERVRKEVRQA